ncbi:MAG: hypothetical protein AAF628_32695 [Planctomycetota bacterium]
MLRLLCLPLILCAGLPMIPDTAPAPALPPRAFPTPGVFEEGAITKIALADMTGHRWNDVVFLRDQHLLYCHHVSAIGAFADTGLGDVDDFALLPRLSGSPDRVLTVGVNGFHLVTYDAAEGGWNPAPLLSSWTNISQIVAGEIGGFEVVVGVEAPTTLRIGIHQPWQEVEQRQVFSTTTEIREVLLADWSGNGTLDVVARTAAGLEIFTALGAPIGSITAGDGDGGIARVGTPDGERLAWVHSSGADWVLRVYEGGVAQQSLLLDFSPTISTLDLVNLAAGDYDGDGYDDLALFHTGSYIPLLPFVPATDGYDALSFSLADVGAVTAADRAPGLFADVNMSGYADLCVGSQTQGSINTFNELRAVFGPFPQTPVGAFGPTGSWPGGQEPEDYPEFIDGTPCLTDLDPWTLVVPIRVPEQFEGVTHLEVIVWHHETPWNQQVTAGAISAERIQLSGQPMSVNIPVPPAHLFGPQKEWTVDDQFYLQIRFLTMAGQEILHQSPTYFYGLGAVGPSAGVHPLNYMRTISNGSAASEEIVKVDNRWLGGIKKRDIKAPFPTNSVPEPGL